MNTEKKFDGEVVKILKKEIKRAIKNKKENYGLSLKENNIVKEINPEYSEDLIGEWNGYGYTRLGKHLMAKNFKKVLKKLSEIKTEKKKVVRTLSDEENQERWANRLSKLSGISVEDAKEIAKEKIDYKQEQIDMMDNRQCENYSPKREKLINKMRRENPLRRITDKEHAQAILAASNRHNNTNYEEKLEEAREEANMGMINRSEVKEYARLAILI